MKAKLFTILKTILVITGLGCVASVLWAGVHYLRSDPRFVLHQIAMPGLKHVSEEEVLDRIQLSTGVKPNIFSVDMEDVRTHVEQLPWVRYASVQRILPDRIIISVTEREPIGLARIDGQISAFDEDAAILAADDTEDSKFPILIGLHADDIEGNLKKIAMYRKTISELSEAQFSEIIVDPSNDVSVVKVDDPMIVSLGVDDFKQRWDRYLLLKSRISSECKDAVRVDLRFRNRVVVGTRDDGGAGKVIWDGKKKSL